MISIINYEISFPYDCIFILCETKKLNMSILSSSNGPNSNNHPSPFSQTSGPPLYFKRITLILFAHILNDTFSIINSKSNVAINQGKYEIKKQ